MLTVESVSDASQWCRCVGRYRIHPPLRCFAFPQVWPDVSFPDHPQPLFSLAGCGRVSVQPSSSERTEPCGEDSLEGIFYRLVFFDLCLPVPLVFCWDCHQFQIKPWPLITFTSTVRYSQHLPLSLLPSCETWGEMRIVRTKVGDG